MVDAIEQALLRGRPRVDGVGSYMHTKEYYTGGNFKALNQFYHEPGHTFHHALLYL